MIEQELLAATLISRYKRFLADVELASGGIATVHCPNPGSMQGLAEPGCRVWLRASTNPKSKLPYAWILTELATGLVCIDTSMANKLVSKALAAGFISELAGYQTIKPEQKFLNSRFDFFLADSSQGTSNSYLEVKSCTLAEGSVAMFPDARTARGRKHLLELMELAKQGLRAVQFFCIMRGNISSFQPAWHIDKEYCETLEKAAKNSVELIVYSAEIKSLGSAKQNGAGSGTARDGSVKSRFRLTLDRTTPLNLDPASALNLDPASALNLDRSSTPDPDQASPPDQSSKLCL